MVKKITKNRWRSLRKEQSAFVKHAFIRNGKRYIYENDKIIEVEVIGMRPVSR